MLPPGQRSQGAKCATVQYSEQLERRMKAIEQKQAGPSPEQHLYKPPLLELRSAAVSTLGSRDLSWIAEGLTANDSPIEQLWRAFESQNMITGVSETDFTWSAFGPEGTTPLDDLRSATPLFRIQRATACGLGGRQVAKTGDANSQLSSKGQGPRFIPGYPIEDWQQVGLGSHREDSSHSPLKQ